MRPPRPSYLVVASPIYKFALQAVFEGLTTSALWQIIPWVGVYWFSAGIGLALVANDIQNPTSWLRDNWREISSPFFVKDVVVNKRSDPERNSLICILRFRRAPKSSDISVYITPTHTQDKGVRRHVFQTNAGKIQKDAEYRLNIGSVMIQHPGWTPRHSLWGQDVGPEALEPGSPTISVGLRVLVTVEVDGCEEKFLVQRSETRDGDGFVKFLPEDARMLMGFTSG